jgi:phosphatidate phosphatase APP1
MPRRGDELDWKKILMRSGGALDRRLDQLTAARTRRKSIALVPYRGFGTESHLGLSGRVLAERAILRASDRESVWRNLLASYQRLQSDEIPGARIRAQFEDQVLEVVSDEEGYFQIALSLTRPPAQASLWHDVALELMEPAQPHRVAARGEVMIPPADAEFGVISDLDDTVIQTGATSLVRMLRSTLLESARSRLPFEGVADFYRLLHRDRNPIFYVSSSPWNLYDLLTEFLAIQQIPAGPLLLGDFGVDDNKLIHAPHDEHKHQQIQRVFDTYPRLPFVLIGDSGQQDPEIYWEVVRTAPDRVKAVMIRDVTNPQRDTTVHTIAARIAELGVEMFLVPDTSTALGHARRLGLVA